MLARIQAALILFSLWLVNLLFRFMTVRAAWNLGEFLGLLTYKALPGRRKIVRNNIEIVAKAHPEIEVTDQLILDIFRRSAANLVCSVKTYPMSVQQLTKYVTIKAHPSFGQAIAAKKGAVLTLAHMGNWEILSKIPNLFEPLPENFGAIYRPLDNKIVDKYVAKQRTSFGCQMFSKRTSVNTFSSFLKKGGILGILADQRAGRSNKNARLFFSEPSPRSKLPAVLAKRTGAPVFAFSVHSKEKATWCVEIKPIELPQSEDIGDIVDTITRSYEERFHSHILDVFWLHRYWSKQLKKTKNTS